MSVIAPEVVWPEEKSLITGGRSVGSPEAMLSSVWRRRPVGSGRLQFVSGWPSIEGPERAKGWAARSGHLDLQFENCL